MTEVDFAVLRDYLKKALDLLPPPPIAVVQVLTSSEALDAALASAPDGASLTLSAELVYPKPLVLSRPVTLKSEFVGSGRMTKEAVAPTFQAGIKLVGDNISLQGLAAQNTNPLTDVVVITGNHISLDRCRIVGDPLKGAKRGIAANGSDMSIKRCFIDDIFQPAQDTQAIGSWDMGPGLTIDDCYLASGTQSVMLGGADPSSEARIPSNVTITNSTLTKNPKWFLGGVQIKCALELKDAINVLVDNCILEYAGTSMGQGAYLCVFTPRNQGGKAPYSTVKNVLISNCTGRFAAGIVTLLGSDNINPSGPCTDITFRDCTFTDIDPKGITGGTGRLFTFDRTPKNVTLDGITVTGQNLSALGYFSGPATTGLVLNRLTLPTAKYGWKIDAGGMGLAALKLYAPDAIIDPNLK